jgi:hypothetical protein
VVETSLLSEDAEFNVVTGDGKEGWSGEEDEVQDGMYELG